MRIEKPVTLSTTYCKLPKMDNFSFKYYIAVQISDCYLEANKVNEKSSCQQNALSATVTGNRRGRSVIATISLYLPLMSF